MAIFRTTWANKRLSARQQDEYDNATLWYICRHECVDNEANNNKVRDHIHITGWLIGATNHLCNLERLGNLNITVFFYNFKECDKHLIAYEFRKRPDREIKIIVKKIE